MLLGGVRYRLFALSIRSAILTQTERAPRIFARSAPAISAPPTCCARAQGPRRGDAARRRAEGHYSPSSYPAISAALNAAMLAALGAFLGHLFPVWLKFKGGKGVAVYIGVLIGLSGRPRSVFCVLWIATAATTRYSSLSALVASFVTPIFLWWFGHPALASLFAVLTLLLFYMHRENIRRLQAGTEGRIGEK